MKKDRIYELGKTLGLSYVEINVAIKKNKNTILAGLIIGLAFVLRINMGYQPLHYIAPSIKDFDLFMRYF